MRVIGFYRVGNGERDSMAVTGLEPVVNSKPGRDDKAVTEAIQLCGGDDVRFHTQIHTLWRTEITSKPQSDDPWTPLGSAAVQQTILMCGASVDDSDLIEEVGELLWREIKHYRRRH